jgi:hypothetical protein
MFANWKSDQNNSHEGCRGGRVGCVYKRDSRRNQGAWGAAICSDKGRNPVYKHAGWLQPTGHRKFNRAISIFKPSQPTSSTYPVYKHTVRFPASKHLTTDENQVPFLFANTLQITSSSLQTFCKDKHTRNSQTTR